MAGRRSFLIAWTSVVLFASASAAQDVSRGHLVFTLESDSYYEEGCMNGLCACPIFRVDGLGGRFTLELEGRDGDRVDYQVRGVRLIVPGSGSGPAHVSGHGTYWIDRAAGRQRMQLDLRLDDQPPRHFDSGEVPTEAEGIRVFVTHDEGACYGYAMEIVAREMLLAPPRRNLPDHDKEPGEHVSWTTLKARFD